MKMQNDTAQQLQSNCIWETIQIKNYENKNWFGFQIFQMQRSFISNVFDVSQTLPQSIDLSKSMPRIYDQGKLGSFVSNSLAAAFEYCKIKEGKETFMPARLFTNYNQRVSGYIRLKKRLEPT